MPYIKGVIVKKRRMFFRKIFIVFFIFSSFSGAVLCKKAAIVVDYTNNKKVVFSKNPDAIRHPASLTKTMTAYLLFEAAKSGKVSLHTKFKTSKFATTQIPTKIGLKVGEKVSVSDLIEAILVKSANDAAVVLAEGMCGSVRNFVRLMNKKAKQLGMNHTHFENASGVPDKRQITTARDMATLSIATYRHFPEYWPYFSKKEFKYRNNKHPTHCKIIRWYRGADGGKTGFTNASGFNLFVTAKKYNSEGKGKRVFVVVMGGDSSKSRDLYAATLLDKYLYGYPIATAKFIPTKPIKSNKKPLIDRIDKEKILIEEEEITFDQILDSSIGDKESIEELYINDEEIMEFVEEEFVVKKLKGKSTRKHRK
ncbi:MAG: D-alanyl-D-alanine carboxypeptidase [Holosporales bacterium]|jgi:D-alanyl-D-alanine carboxypeptidase|nr:D-alanyl-D-alanine carboxypeptidase [Holosporales bacterium]